MKAFAIFIFLSLNFYPLLAQISPFEMSNGNRTATYFEAIDWYKGLSKKNINLRMREMGETDAGYPLHLIMLSSDGSFDPGQWHSQGKIVIMINNGIHPGEPDGIDASMMLVRDLLSGKIKLPSNVVLGIIPVYNIGGTLNRNSYTRANQNGPDEYGFRGNSQNLDLNRDFTKNDSREAGSFARIFHYLNPEILIDNHVSDGADYQHTITLISTQYEKLSPVLGKWLKKIFEPAIYKSMALKNWELIPYVDFDNTSFEKGMTMFYDPPRYSSGYAALFNCISFMPETHMLKPFKERVSSTYDLMVSFISESSRMAVELVAKRKEADSMQLLEREFPLKWLVDTSAFSTIIFKGYNRDSALSKATGLRKIFYNHDKPYTKNIKYFNVYKAADLSHAPFAYIIPAGWYTVIDRLAANGIIVSRLKQDSVITIVSYQIDQFKSLANSYEKHHKNYNVVVSSKTEKKHFLAGDYLVLTAQKGKRYLVEMLDPRGEDSFFAWNFFDGILQQKEGYSDYRWEDVAANLIRNDSTLRKKVEQRKASDANFAQSSALILDFIYRNSAFFEKAYLHYPVYSIEH